MRFHKIDIRGKFWLPDEEDVNSITHNGSIDEGRMFHSRSDDAIYYGDSDEWVFITRRQDVMSVDSKVMMGEYPLPNNWNIDFGSNDLVPLISNDETEGGSYGGSWTITGMQNQGSHNHGGLTGVANNPIIIGSSDIYTSVAGDNHRHTLSTDGLHSHTHNGTWRPKYTKFIIVRYEI